MVNLSNQTLLAANASIAQTSLLRMAPPLYNSACCAPLGGASAAALRVGGAAWFECGRFTRSYGRFFAAGEGHPPLYIAS